MLLFVNLPRLSLVRLGPLFSSSLSLFDLGDFGVIRLSDMTADLYAITCVSCILNVGPESLGCISIRM